VIKRVECNGELAKSFTDVLITLTSLAAPSCGDLGYVRRAGSDLGYVRRRWPRRATRTALGINIAATRSEPALKA